MNKYHARKVDSDGYTFDSQTEWRYYNDLLLRQRAGEIEDLVVHPKYKLHINGGLICTYVADFSYVDAQTHLTVIEDVKGVRTAVFIIKKKLMKAILGIDVIEVKA